MFLESLEASDMSTTISENSEDRDEEALFIPFQSHQVPAISITDYLVRIARYSQCSEACFIVALIYIDRLTIQHPSFCITPHNIHR